MEVATPRAACLEAALLYAAWGWRVIPLWWPVQGGCACGNPACGTSSGKHPLIGEWVNAATTHPPRIRSWWKRWPLANVGLVTGSSTPSIFANAFVKAVFPAPSSPLRATSVARPASG